MCFGIPAIDAYTHLIRPGELAVLGAGPKVGKSWFLDWVALMDWLAGRTPVLFTLENTVEETLDRIACMYCHIRYDLWQSGQVDAGDVERVHEAVKVFQAGDRLWVVQPDLGRASVESLVHTAKVYGGDSLIIDQLSHIDLPESRRPPTERIGDALRILVKMIGSGRTRMSCLLAHQMSRDGVKRAEKTGSHKMYDFADSAQIERVAHWAFALHGTRAERMVGVMKFQTLAFRRAVPKHWSLDWNVTVGSLQAHNEIELEDD